MARRTSAGGKRKSNRANGKKNVASRGNGRSKRSFLAKLKFW